MKPLNLETGKQCAHWSFFFLRTLVQTKGGGRGGQQDITDLKGKLKTKNPGTNLKQHQEFYGDVT